MNLALTDEQRQLRAVVRSFLEKLCTKDWLDELEERQAYPYDLFDGLAEIVVAGEKEVDPVAALTHLSKRDATRVLALGGGAFNFTLFDLDLVDDYYLTLVPTIIGGQTAPTPVDGRGLKIDERKSLTLVDWRQEAQEIFLHYQVL